MNRFLFLLHVLKSRNILIIPDTELQQVVRSRAKDNGFWNQIFLQDCDFQFFWILSPLFPHFWVHRLFRNCWRQVSIAFVVGIATIRSSSNVSSTWSPTSSQPSTVAMSTTFTNYHTSSDAGLVIILGSFPNVSSPRHDQNNTDYRCLHGSDSCMSEVFLQKLWNFLSITWSEHSY